MTTIFTQDHNLGPFGVEIHIILWTWSALQAVIFLSWDKSRDPTANRKLEDKQTTLFRIATIKTGQVARPSPQVRLKMNDKKPSKFQFYFSEVLEAFSTIKKMKKKILAWTTEIIQFIPYPIQMGRTERSNFFGGKRLTFSNYPTLL